jgi:hypothetical protein
LQAIGVLENLRMETNIQMELKHVSTPKIKSLGIKKHEIQVVQIILQIKK